MRPLTAQQRYRQAMRKADLIWRRNLRKFMAGEMDQSGPPLLDLRRQAITAEIDRLIQA